MATNDIPRGKRNRTTAASVAPTGNRERQRYRDNQRWGEQFYGLAPKGYEYVPNKTPQVAAPYYRLVPQMPLHQVIATRALIVVLRQVLMSPSGRIADITYMQLTKRYVYPGTKTTAPQIQSFLGNPRYFLEALDAHLRTETPPLPEDIYVELCTLRTQWQRATLAYEQAWHLGERSIEHCERVAQSAWTQAVQAAITHGELTLPTPTGDFEADSQVLFEARYPYYVEPHYPDRVARIEAARVAAQERLPKPEGLGTSFDYALSLWWLHGYEDGCQSHPGLGEYEDEQTEGQQWVTEHHGELKSPQEEEEK